MFRTSFKGTLLQLFPLHEEVFFELTAAGDIDVTGKTAILFCNACNITIDGSAVSVPIEAGAVFAIASGTTTISADSALVYGLV